MFLLFFYMYMVDVYGINVFYPQILEKMVFDKHLFQFLLVWGMFLLTYYWYVLLVLSNWIITPI